MFLLTERSVTFLYFREKIFIKLLRKSGKVRGLNKQQLVFLFVGMANVVDIELENIMEQSQYPFETVRVSNRLDMEIDIDICSIHADGELIIVVRANERYHRSSIEKNIEHIAFQLKQRYSPASKTLSIVEYVDRHARIGKPPEWRQWRFKWVGNSPVNSSHYLLSQSAFSNIHNALLSKPSLLQFVS